MREAVVAIVAPHGPGRYWVVRRLWTSHPPTWFLKAERCSYCDVGELVFLQCRCVYLRRVRHGLRDSAWQARQRGWRRVARRDVMPALDLISMSFRPPIRRRYRVSDLRVPCFDAFREAFGCTVIENHEGKSG